MFYWKTTSTLNWLWQNLSWKKAYPTPDAVLIILDWSIGSKGDININVTPA